MHDQILNPPPQLPSILAQTQALGFTMASDALTGSLLRTLAAAKPAGRLLEIGTGTGLATAWLLAGMDRAARLLTLDNDERVQAGARSLLADERITFCCADAGEWLSKAAAAQFDLIFADAWPGKYSHLDETLRVVKRGGLYVIDDLLPQPNWPENHAPRVAELLAVLANRNDLTLTKLHWSTGIIIAAKIL